MKALRYSDPVLLFAFLSNAGLDSVLPYLGTKLLRVHTSACPQINARIVAVDWNFSFPRTGPDYKGGLIGKYGFTEVIGQITYE